MPPRPRRTRKAGELTPALALALRIGRHPMADTPTDAELRAAWGEHGEKVIAMQPASPPDGFWRFDRRAPAELRTPADEQPFYPADDLDERDRRRQRDQDRRRWWSRNVHTNEETT